MEKWWFRKGIAPKMALNWVKDLKSVAQIICVVENFLGSDTVTYRISSAWQIHTLEDTSTPSLQRHVILKSPFSFESFPERMDPAKSLC